MLKRPKLPAFTLIEILVVIAIIAILAAIGIGSYGSIQSKARDARRKSDLENIARALEMYYNDKKYYPSESSGQIVGAGWGDSWSPYMQKVPKDTKYSYFYDRVTARSYRLFARLENKEDQTIARDTSVPSKNPGTYEGTTCGSKRCNYGITSTNESLPAIANGDY